MGEGRSVSREFLGRFLVGFEWLNGEEEIVVVVDVVSWVDWVSSRNERMGV
jgi:hypothetical protein